MYNNMQWTGFNFVTWVLFFLWLNSCFCKVPKCNNCCNSYKNISEPRRSVSSTWKRGQTPLCDRFLRSGWYHFKSFNGTRMPEKAVPYNHCGTHNPIWLNSRHPTENNRIVAGRACISSFGDTCRYPFTIGVKRCSKDFFVYYLRPVFFCATAYCAGEETNLPQSIYFESLRLRKAITLK